MKTLHYVRKVYPTRMAVQLFLVFAFPFHVWYFLMAFRDFQWVAERTELWDAVGLVAYALAFALVETIGFFLGMLLLGLLLSTKWQDDQRLVLIATLGMIIAGWAIFFQAYSLLESPMPAHVIAFLVRIDHPLRVLWAGAASIAVLSVSIPLFAVLRSNQLMKTLTDLFDRVTAVSTLYLAIDVIAFAIIAIRNIRI